MPYTALYRKWRPDTFEDVKGQDHIVTTLKNQIRTGRIGHAYLFCGTRGTGKTTIAKIFARAVNCEHPEDASPCNHCKSCESILAGASINVVEIDAASNNGVENIREIRDEVQYSPAEGRYRVYIIDEVHMLSTGAFNALLKTLEEPPSYVIFILATTEPNKIPITVLSRCQRYDFHRISIETISQRLKTLTDGEGVDVEERALRYIAKKGDGSMRDSISLLDQCIAFHYGETLTYEKVLDVLGAVDNEILGELLKLALAGKTAECIYKIEEIVMQGRELTQMVTDFVWYLRNLLLLKASDVDADVLGISEENLASLAEIAMETDADTLMYYIRVFSELLGKIRYASDKRVLIEVTFVRLTHPEMEKGMDALAQRMSLLEKKLAEGVAPRAGEGSRAAAYSYSKEENASQLMPEEKAQEQVNLPKAQYETLKFIQEKWDAIVEHLPGSARASLLGTAVEPAEEGVLCIVFSNPRNHFIGARPAVLDRVREYVENNYQMTLEFKTRLKQENEPEKVYGVGEEGFSAFRMDIEIEGQDTQ